MWSEFSRGKALFGRRIEQGVLLAEWKKVGNHQIILLLLLVFCSSKTLHAHCLDVR